MVISGGHNDELHLNAFTDSAKHDATIRSFKLPFGGEDWGVTGDDGIVIVNDMLLTDFIDADAFDDAFFNNDVRFEFIPLFQAFTKNLKLVSRGIDVKVPPTSILDENFQKEVKKHKRVKTMVAENEHAVRLPPRSRARRRPGFAGLVCRGSGEDFGGVRRQLAQGLRRAGKTSPAHPRRPQRTLWPDF